MLTQKKKNEIIRNARKAIKAARASAEKADTRPVSPKDITNADYGGEIATTFKKKGRTNEVIVVGRRKVNFRNKDYDLLDIRTFYFYADEKKWKPSQKGITLPFEDSIDIAEAIVSAFRKKG